MSYLGSQILAQREHLVHGWLTFARTLQPAEAHLSDEELRDSIPELLNALAASVDTAAQTAEGDASDSSGEPATVAARIVEYSRSHAGTRLSQGFGLHQVVAEYAALRVDVLTRCIKGAPEADHAIREAISLDRAVDRCLFESVAWFGQKLSSARDLVLGILGHDLRSPLGAISMSATLLLKDSTATPRTAKIATRVATSAERMSKMIHDLLDFARTRMGGRLPITTVRMPLAPLITEAIEEMRAALPDALIRCSVEGSLEGDWDADRIHQLLGNLIANAYQHGDPDEPIDVIARELGDEVDLYVRNQGPPIPDNVRMTLFEPLTQGSPASADDPVLAGSLGLGLYICREIARAHGGRIDAASSQDTGTTFCVRMPAGPKERRR